MIKKASVLVLTGAITISTIGLTTTSFADVKDENLLIPEISTKLQNQVVSEQDGSVRVAGEDGQIRTADDVIITKGNNGQVPQVDNFGNVTLPTGGKVIFANGTEVIDIGSDHSIITPRGSVITPNGKGGVPKVNSDGTVNVPEGSMVVLPIGYETTPPKDSVVSNNGDITTSSGVNIKANGTVVVPGPDGKVGTPDDVTINPYRDINGYGEIPTVDNFGNVTLPTGGHVLMADGSIVTDRGDDHSIIVSAGTVITPNGNGGVPTVNSDGTVKVPEGSMVVLPNGKDITPQNGSVVGSNGSITSPDGSVTNTDGSVINPGGGVDNSNGSVTNPGGGVDNSNGSVTNQGGGVDNSNGSVTNPEGDVNTENPKTGDTSIIGILALGSMALLALIKNIKIKDKLF